MTTRKEIPLRLSAVRAALMTSLRAWGTWPLALATFCLVIAQGGQARASWLDLSSSVYGANQSVVANLGQVSYITGCGGLGGGIDDWIYPYADVYVVPQGGGMTDVSNANGIPNTLFYIILGEVLANTGPGGYLISGDYEILIDECQNGKLDPIDWRGAPFSVRIPATVDPLSSAAFASQLASTKAAADAQRQSWNEAMLHMSAIFTYMNISTAWSICTNPAEFILFACTNINLDTGTVYCSLTDAWKDLLNLQLNVLMTMANASNYYRGIAADPPDPDFRALPVLEGGLSVNRGLSEPWMQAAFSFGETASQAQALSKALLAAMEKYQGAQQAGIGEYAYVQARFVERYARALAEAAPRVAASFQNAADALNASGLDYVGTLDLLRATQTRVAASGLSPAERAQLIAEGWNNSQVAAGVADFLDRDFSGLASTADLAAMAARMNTEAVSLASALTAFADAMATEQAQIAAQLNLPFPTANAGGPYIVNEGVALTLSAAASSHPDLPNSKLTFAWDLDLDGQFDDASGETPSFTFMSERDGLVGVKVTAPTGYADVAYARLTVDNVNSAPRITASSPGVPLTVPHDGSQLFSVTATDPDAGDLLSYSWDLDGTVVGSGAAYLYTASLADVGPHVVTVTVRDNSPLSPDTRLMWAMVVTAPDTDGDGYGENVDCAPDDPAVNPGATEVPYNGIDDDCNPATPDDPDGDNDGYEYTVDCNDHDPAVHPGAPEICNGVDDNCNGTVDEGFDADGDHVTTCGGDCDDGDNTVYPGAPEVCDLKDNDCDLAIDEGSDADGDGVTLCAGDCGDDDPAVHPGATEVCNGKDDNCDGTVDEGFDADGDGYTTCGGDCDDGDPKTYPLAPELCDSKDNNCNTVADEGVDTDWDGDGQSTCAGDCNDTDATIFLGAPETCNNKDDNCDGTVDDGFDTDLDGFTTCGGDCLDTDPTVYPGRPEVFHNGKDDDCNTATLDNYRNTFIIVPDDDGRVYYAKSNGDGTWSNYKQLDDVPGTSIYTRGVAIADFDNDGDLDFLLPFWNGSSLQLYLYVNDGADSFTNTGVAASAPSTSNAYGMTAGDFNNDGNMDFLVSGNSAVMAIGLGNGRGGFSVTTMSVAGNGREVDVADFNHDGFPDVVRGVSSSGQISLFMGNGTGTFAAPVLIADSGTDPYGVIAADFNNDGHPDIIANAGSNGDTFFYAGKGDGTFLAGVAVGSLDFNNYGAYDNYDFNGDGNQDVVTASYSSRIISFYPGNGNGTFGAAVRVNPSNTNGYILGISAPPGPPPAGDPVAFISPPTVTATPGATIDLTGKFSTDNGSIVTYAWDFGDGATGSGRDVTHSFPALEGEYLVRLTVTDDSGRKAVGGGRVRLLGAAPVADAGGPYTFGEDKAVGGVYTVSLNGSASSDDSTPLSYRWDLGNGLNETFDSPSFPPELWTFSSNAVVSGGEAVVTGVGNWTSQYLVTKAAFTRNAGDSYTGRISVKSGGNRHVMWGLKNTNTDYNYTQFFYAIYFNNGNVQIYEGGSSIGTFGTFTDNTSYDLRIDVKTFGATYYYRKTGVPTWTKLYETYNYSDTTFRFGATIHSGEIRFDDFMTPNLSSTLLTPTATYQGEGSYPVSLTVTDIAGQTDTDTTFVNLVKGSPPVANPGGPYTPGENQANCGNWTLTLNGAASSDDAGIYRYDWNFGDGTANGAGVSTNHTYSGNSARTVTLTVTDNALQTHSATTSMTPTPGANPVANPGGPYTVDESAASAGLWTVNLNGSASTDDVGLCDFQWNFGDGTTGTGANVSHQYAAAGTYTVTLTVRDHALQSHSASTTVTVNVNQPPVARHGGPYMVDENQAKDGQWTAQFDGSTSSDDFGIWKYEWNFGDGTAAGTGAKPSHVYTAPGVYTVTLTVTDVGRQTHTVATTITVQGNDPPVANAGTAHVTEAGLPVTLDASGSTDDFNIWKHEWSFGQPPWYASNLAFKNGYAVINGNGSWGPNYLVTGQTFARNAGDSYTGRLLAKSGGNRYVMWGLKNSSTSVSASNNYNQWYYAIYFYNNEVYIYEGGSSRGKIAGATWSDNTSYDLRIDVKATGATYYYRQTDTAAWTTLYNSTYSNASPFRLGATVNSGEIHLRDFTAPPGAIALPAISPTAYGNSSISTSSLPAVQVAYAEPGTYHPQVTVTDHAQQATTASTTVTVVPGLAPVADTGGPYYTNEDVPTRFNAKASSDDFGIASYAWDFGDGEGLTTKNFWVDHRYTAAGTYTATLTVTDYSGKTATESTTVVVSADPVVACVPWAFSGGIEVPHDTWSGKEVTLKAVAWSLRAPLTYTWNFGDGSAPATGTVSNKRVIEAKHTYTGVEGAPFVATLTITDADGRTATDNYLIRIRAKSIDIEINKAIDDGLWWLHKNQMLNTFAAGTYGNARVDYGYWDNGGGYSGTSYTLSPTASAVQAFQTNAHLETGNVRENPYVETVARSMRYLPHVLRPIAIGMQTYGDPDTNHNGIGVEQSYNNRPPYEVGQAMDAVVASANKGTFSITGPAGVRDRSYLDLVWDMADVYFWGQTDGASGGGWRYSWNSDIDNSAAQWGAIGLLAAEKIWGIAVPQWVKDRNNIWMTTSYNGTGFGYSGPGHGTNTTPSGLVQLAFDDQVGYDDPATPADDRDPRWRTAEDYIANNWSGTWWYPNSSTNNRFTYYGYYAFTKAMRTAYPKPVTNLRATGLDWFKDDTRGMARRLINRQASDGGWPMDQDPGSYVGYDLTTAWSVIILTPTLFVQPPVADAGEDRVWGVDVPIRLDGSRSYHLDPFRSIVLYEWDVNGDGIFDTASTDPTFTHTYSRTDYPESTLPRNITVTLKVTDNNSPTATDTDTMTLTLAVPPHPPVAEAAGPYTCTAGIPCMLDGSGSFDIDPTDFITAWEWDLNNDRVYNDATGEKPLVVFAAPGLYNIGLRVLDNAVLNDLDGDGVQDPEERLEDFAFATATVLVNNAPLADANGPYTVPEGSSVILDGSGSSDPDGNPITHAWDLDNDGLFNDATVAKPVFNGVDDGVYPVAIEVSDTLLTDTATSSVTVTNVAPTANAGPDQTVDEGSPVIFTGGFTDPGTLDTHTIAWTFGDGASDAGNLAPTHNYPADNGGYTATLTVTDDDGGAGADTLTVTIRNVAPAVDAGPDRGITEGGSVSLSPATFTDPGLLDTHTATINWGDGTIEAGTVTEAAGSGSVAGSHAYAQDGVYTVSVTVTDDDGGVTSDTFTVTVLNAPPDVAMDALAAISEGQSVTVSASFTDAGVNDTHTATVDWGDGSSSAVPVTEAGGSGTVTATHLYPENGSYLVTITVNDNAGASGGASRTATVGNLPPVVAAGANQSVPLGIPVTLDPASFTDPGVTDTHTAVIDWGDGTVDAGVISEAGGSGHVFGDHVYAAEGTYTVTVSVTDDEGASGADSLTIQIFRGNTPPVVDAGPDASIPEGGVLVRAGSFSDPDPDTWTATVDYGDGSGLKPLPLNPDQSFDLNHAYADNGVYTLTVTVLDSAGASGSDTARVTVMNVAPLVDAGPDAGIGQGGTFSGSGSFTDPGADLWSATVDYGDGTGVQPLVLKPDKTFDLSHVYVTAGSFTVRVSVSDDDGGAGSDTLTVTVTPPISPVCGDLDHDLDVDVRDKNLLFAALRVCSGQPGYLAEADYDGDGCITFNDYREWYKCYLDYARVLAKNFGGTAGSPGDLDGDGDVDGMDLVIWLQL